jgi:ABC-type sulfate transport system permease component
MSTVGTSESHGIWSWLRLVVGLLSPFFLLNVLGAVLLAYLFVSVVIWLRTIQRVDAEMQQAERRILRAVEQSGQQSMREVDQQIQAFRREWRDLEAIV